MCGLRQATMSKGLKAVLVWVLRLIQLWRCSLGLQMGRPCPLDHVNLTCRLWREYGERMLHEQGDPLRSRMTFHLWPPLIALPNVR